MRRAGAGEGSLPRRPARSTHVSLTKRARRIWAELGRWRAWKNSEKPRRQGLGIVRSRLVGPGSGVSSGPD